MDEKTGMFMKSLLQKLLFPLNFKGSTIKQGYILVKSTIYVKLSGKFVLKKYTSALWSFDSSTSPNYVTVGEHSYLLWLGSMILVV